MSTYKYYLLGLACLMGLLSACGGGDSKLPPERPVGSISGNAVDGVIRGGHVAVYAYAEGRKSERIGSGVTDDEGFYRVDVQARTQAVLIEVTGGRYVEEASGVEVPLGEGVVLSAVARYESGQALAVMVTPLTHLAAGLATHKLRLGAAVDEAVRAATVEVSSAFGFEVARTVPHAITNERNLGGELSDAHVYGFLLAGISSWTHWAGEQNNSTPHTVYSSVALSQLMYHDMQSDGLLDGRGFDKDGSALMDLAFGVVPLNADVYRIAFMQHMLAMANGAQNKTGLGVNDVRGRALTLASAAHSLFGGPVPAGSGEHAPEVYALDPEGFFYGGVFDFALVVSGTAVSVSADVDGVAIGVASDPAKPVIAVDTRNFGDGEHHIGVRAEDGLGNESYRQFLVRFDNTAPFANVTSAPVTNQRTFLLQGDYVDNGAGVSEMRVQDQVAQLPAVGVWQAQVNLVPGRNVVPVVVVDSAGNEYRAAAEVSLDEQAPRIDSVGRHGSATFALAAGLEVAPLTDSNELAPLVLDSDRLDLAGVAMQRIALQDNQIPWFGFEVFDPEAAGVSTPASSLAVEMQYERDGIVLAPWRALNAAAGEGVGGYLVPLASEVLSEQWHRAPPVAQHVVRVRVRDQGGNVSEQSYTFRLDVRVPAPVQVGVTDAADELFLNATFNTRGQLHNRDLAAMSYTFTNTSKKAYYVSFSDSAQHMVEQVVDELARENLARLKTATEWRAAFVDDSLRECPPFPAAGWKTITQIYNRSAAGWELRQPSPDTMGEIEALLSDTPVAPTSTLWADVPHFDNVYWPRDVRGEGDPEREILHYDFDYVEDTSLAGLSRPAYFTNWNLRVVDVNGNVLRTAECPSQRYLQERKVYGYISETGYPRNVSSEFAEQAGFATSGYRVLDQATSEEIVAVQGWYRVPPNVTVRVEKLVKTPALTVHDDREVVGPDFNSYEKKRYDRRVTWTLQRPLRFSAIHDAGEQHVFAMSASESEAGSGMRSYSLGR